VTLPLFPADRAERPHTCHARGCERAVPPELLMCGQRAVWAAYRPGQCEDKRPSEAWHLAADAAIGYVARAEGQPVRQVELEAIRSFGVALCGSLL